MTTSPTIQATLSRYQNEISMAMQQAMQHASQAGSPTSVTELSAYYGQMRYHLGWVDANFSPLSGPAGKLMRPTLLLLAYEAAGANGFISRSPSDISHLRSALPAAAALELTHNFTLIHDDIVDEDIERHHRSTLWSVWGVPQAINTGDGMYALARYTLWSVLDAGVEAAIAVQLAKILDRTCLIVAEGQYLDMSFESSQHISVDMYLDMIGRKTAALLECSAEMGAVLGTSNAETIERLRNFGHTIGIAFQVRDDMLGVWASTVELGKTPAGDIYRRKKSLPILHALEKAAASDQQLLQEIYRQESPVTDAQVKEVLAVFERTQTRTYCRNFLAKQCQAAFDALDNVPRTTSALAERALHDMKRLVDFVETTAQE